MRFTSAIRECGAAFADLRCVRVLRPQCGLAPRRDAGEVLGWSKRHVVAWRSVPRGTSLLWFEGPA